MPEYLEPIGFYKSGRPIYPILGGSEDADTADDTDTDDEADTDTTDTDTDDTDAGAEALGDPGKKALDAMKAKWKAERTQVRELKKQLADAAAKKTDTGDDADKPDLDKIRSDARAQAQAETLRERVMDKIEAKAAGKFRDVEDAVLRLGRNVDDYIDDGKIDIQQIESDLADLLTKRPDFGVAQGEQKRFKGSADAGAKPDGKSQLSKTQVEQMYREGKADEIEAARQAGRLNKILGIAK